MGIRITTPDEEYPEVCMAEQSITQELIRNVNDPVVYTVSLVWKRYKVDQVTGETTYAPEPAGTYYNADFKGDAVTKYFGGDYVLATALNANQAAVAQIFSEETGYPVETY